MSWYNFDDDRNAPDEYYYEAGETIGGQFQSGAWCRRCGRWGLWVMNKDGNWRIDHECTGNVAPRSAFDVLPDDPK